MTKSIVLVHGAWLNPVSWDGFKSRYEARGYKVIAPAWPYDERSPAELRANPNPELAKVGLSELVDHYDKIVRALPEKPYIISHSAGGVFTQFLLNRGLGQGGVAIDPAPTPGVGLGRHAIVSALPAFTTLGSGHKVLHMSRKFFANRFAQTLPRGETDAAYDRYIVPTPGKLYWDGILKPPGKIRWDNPARPPLLLIAGGKDLIADATMTRAIYLKQKRAPSVTSLKHFADRSHWTCLDRGWEKVADTAIDWLERRAPG